TRQVGDEPEPGDAHEQPTVHGAPIVQTAERLDGDADGDRQQRRAVHQGGQDLESQQAERALRRGGTVRQVGDAERGSERTPSGETYRAVAPVGNTWDGPAR